MSYVNTVDYQARKFGAGSTVSFFSLAIAAFFLDLATPTPLLKPIKERPLVVFPIPGVEDKQSALKVFDLPKPEKVEPEVPKKFVTDAPAEEKKTSSPQSEEVELAREDSPAEQMGSGIPTIWTPPPPKREKSDVVERKEVKKIDMPKLVVNDDRAEKKIDVNRPPRLVQAREERMDDVEVIEAVRRLQSQIHRPSRPGQAPKQVVLDDQIIQEGTVALQFKVKANGSIVDCAVAISSGSDVLDKRACQLVSSFLYEPGTDEKGQKVEKTMIETIEWLGGDNARAGSGQVVGVPGSISPSRPIADRRRPG